MSSSVMAGRRAFTGRQRKTLTQHTEAFDDLDDYEAEELRLQELEELETDYGEAQDFRSHSESTQAQQDRHLRNYTWFVFRIVLKKDPNTLSSEERDRYLFPDSHILAKRMSLFLAWVFKKTNPRALCAGTIAIETLSHYRNSILFWADRYYEKNGTKFPRFDMWYQTNKTMRYVHSKYSDARQKTTDKTWLGLAELRQLLDFEAANNRNIEISEQHQVLWCLARLTALRPGSLCPGARYARSKPLTWSDFKFMRGKEAGQIDMRMIVHATIKRAEDPLARDVNPVHHPLSIRIDSPDPRNLIFSPAHRLLVIALRRGIVEGIDNVDDLVYGPLANINIVEERKHDVVFYASKARGLALDWDNPMKSHSLSTYLGTRGYQLGYVKGISYYSIRRRSATDMAVRYGPAYTRMLMGHAPNTTTLERYYLNLAAVIDQSSLLLGGEAKIDTNTDNWADLALSKLSDQAYARSRGVALSNLTRRLILADPNPPVKPTDNEMKAYRQRARRFAKQQLLAQEANVDARTITNADKQKRVRELQASNFSKQILARALDAVKQQGSIPDIGAAVTDDTDNDPTGANLIGGDHAGLNEISEEEEDLEETAPKQQQEGRVDANGDMVLGFDTDADAEDPGMDRMQEVTYGDLAKATMELLISNTLSQQKLWNQKDQTCPLCQEDETVARDEKAQKYKSEAKLDDHLTGQFHTEKAKWRRAAKIRASEVREAQPENTKPFVCLYCEKAEDVPEPRAYGRIQELEGHVASSGLNNFGLTHDKLKAADGWYDDDWIEEASRDINKYSLEKARSRGIKNLKDAGVQLDTSKPVFNPEPYEHSDALEIGTHLHTLGIVPGHLQSLIAVGRPPDTSTLGVVPDHLSDIITAGAPSMYPLPAYLRKDVTATDEPRSPEEKYVKKED